MMKLSPLTVLKSLTPSNINIIAGDFFNRTNTPDTHIRHLESSIKWLCNSQDATGSGGCSATYDIFGGWNLAYPETTGYIISTFLRYATFTKDNSYVDRARKMGDWEIDIQLPSGAVRGGLVNNEYPIVFNTGMVVLGWADLYHITGEKKYLDAAVRAADWLCSVMDEDGKWTKYEFKELPHAYCSRVSWSLLEVYRHTKDNRYKQAARNNICWVLSGVHVNGWIDHMSFYGPAENPLTHTIAYTLRGLLESSSYFKDDLQDEILRVVKKASEQIMNSYLDNPSIPNRKISLLPGRYTSEWKPASDFSCLTGNAQMAIIWLKLYQLFNDNRFLNTAVRVIDELKKVQKIKHPNVGIRGAIAGSYPIWGGYCPFSYLNWAVKFYADALMLSEAIRTAETREVITEKEVIENII